MSIDHPNTQGYLWSISMSGFMTRKQSALLFWGRVPNLLFFMCLANLCYRAARGLAQQRRRFGVCRGEHGAGAVLWGLVWDPLAWEKLLWGEQEAGSHGLGNSSACCRARCFALGGELHRGVERRLLHRYQPPPRCSSNASSGRTHHQVAFTVVGAARVAAAV